ncbi:MAG TPA: peptidylprolyl isomerase [Planctomycetota bacterium]|nr:peptidylprolyl isomerase [Planctomycetota bacterium]
MRLVLLAVAVVLAPSFAGAQDSAPSTLKLTLSADRAKAGLGQEIQFEARLENTGDKEVEIADFQYEARSLSFSVNATFTGAGDRKRDYVLAVTRPEPQVADKLPLPRIALGPKKSVTLLHRTHAVGVGKFEYTAKYAGGSGEISSAPVKVDVEATNQGGRLAAVVEVEEAGSFKVVLSPEVSPANVTHLASLIARGFYNDSQIHRVVKSNWIQMGCPYGVGVGGPGYATKAELDKLSRHEPGSVSMSGYDKNGYTGSQFFICLATLPSLDGKYTPVGRVDNEDMGKVVEPLSKRDTDRNTDMPRPPIKIKTVTLQVVK